MSTQQQDNMDSPVLIGMACRVPGATTSGQLWDNIVAGTDLRRPMPKDRFNIDAFYHPSNTHKGTINTKYGYFIDQPLGDFDAEFFGVSGKEAEAMDPQQRMLLEVAYEALENAGVAVEDIRGSRTSVYCGMYTTSNDYHNLQGKDLEYYPKYAITGTGNSILSNRISYAYNLHGPSMTVDTGCSSSLGSLPPWAGQSLTDGEADMSIIVGSALHFGPNTYQTMSDMGFISSDGRCRSFDADGSGYVRGDGICAVVLKRHDRAVAAGDNILAVVRGSGVNHDGKTDGITLPSPEAQEALIRATYAKAGIHPDDTGYIEAHGTGTKAGDPREARAIGAFFGTQTRQAPLFMGSVKSNIGHLEGAAGLAGIIKATLAIQNNKIPPNMHFNTPNPDIPFDVWKLKVPTSALDWAVKDGSPRRASVNSFGYGGANAHVVLEQYLQGSAPLINGVHEAQERPYLLPISSHSQQAGDMALQKHADYLLARVHMGTIVRDLAYSLGTRRSLHAFRTFAVGSDPLELGATLSGAIAKRTWTSPLSSPVRVGFVFTGQGAQVFDMGRQLLQLSPGFRRTLARCDETLQQLPDKPDWCIVVELLRPEEDSRLGQSKYSQPICTALQLALVNLLADWGVQPAAVCGHSSGEIAAAYSAGILSLEGAIVAAYYRGLHMASGLGKGAISGAMMAAGLSQAEAEVELAPYAGRLNVAAVNSPSSVTISGDAGAIAELLKSLSARKIFARQLKVEQAFHSHHMLPMAPRYQAALDECGLVSPRDATCRMFSSVTARVAEPRSMGAAYWAENMVKPVRFSDAVIGMLIDENEEPTVDVLLELGPHPVLRGPVKEILKILGLEKTPYVATLSRDRPALESLLETAGQLFTLGYPVNLEAANGRGNRLEDLPTYAWNHKNYWSLTRLIKEHLHRPSRHTLLGVPVPGAIHHMPRWRNYIRLHEIPWLRDHCVDGKVVFPAAGFCCMAIEAAVRLRQEPATIAAIRLKEVLIKAPLALREDNDEGAETMLELRPVAASARTFDDHWYEFSVASYDEAGQEMQHCHGRISIEYGAPKPLRSLSKVESAEALVARSDRYMAGAALYTRLDTINLHYGDYFALLRGDIASGPGFSVTSFTFDPSVFPPHEVEEKTILHPTLLDSMFHVLFSAIETRLGRQITDAFVSTYMASLDISGLLVEQAGKLDPRNYTVQTHTELPSRRTAVNHILLHQDDTGELIIEATGNEVTALGTDSSGQGRSLFFRQRWQPCFDLLEEGGKGAASTGSLGELAGLYAFQHPSSKILFVTPDVGHGEALFSGLTVPVTGRPLYETAHVMQPQHSEEGTTDAAGGAITVVSEPQGQYDLVILDSGAGIAPEALAASLSDHAVLITNISSSAVQPSVWSTITTSPSGWAAYRSAETSPPAIDVTVVLSSKVSDRTKAVVSQLESSAHVATLTTTTIEQVSSHELSTRHVVVLGSLDAGDIETPEVWAGIRHLLIQEDITLVWTVQDATMQAANPEHAKILGLLRVARNENQRSRFLSLDVEASSQPDLIARRILQVVDPTNAEEEDFADRSGRMYIPRIEEDTALNRKLPDGPGHEPRPERYGDKMGLSLRIGKIGLLETLHFVDEDEAAAEALADDEVEVRVKASALNFHDLAVALGIIQDYKMGSECAGIVTRVGAGVQADDALRPGDRVVAYRPGQGAHGTVMRQPADACVKMPDSMSFAQAAGLPVMLTTAYYSLITLGRVRAGETVLIHSAAGAVGQVAIQLAQRAGARVLVTCSQPKRELLRERYGLSDEAIFSSRDDSFVSGVLEATGGQGVDIVLNSLAGRLLHATWNCIRPFGRFIEVGKRDIHLNSNLGMEPFRRNVVFASVDMILVHELDPKLSRELLRETLRLVFDGEIRPPEGLFEFSYGQVERAFRLMQLGRHTGKIVLVPDDDEAVMVAPPAFSPNRALFAADKTYLLVGGLGGLGTAVAEWMFLRGARRFDFLSRSGDQKDYARKTVAWLRSKGAEVVVHRGDVGKLTDVEAVVRQVGPSLAGVFHIAVVLQDAMIRSLSVEQLQTGLRTKCAGAWNLHVATKALPLDFFVCWSSVSAICGNKGQGAYVAANAYMDALVRWRRGQGLVGTAMNLGAVPTRGLVAENEQIRKSLDRNKLDILTEQELMFLVEEAVVLDGPSAGTDDKGLDWHQLIVGVNTQQPDVWWAERSVFRTLYANRAYGAGAGSGGRANGEASLSSRLAAAVTTDEKATVLQGAFIQKVATVLGTPSESIVETNPLSFYGLDSIVAVEFRKWFKEAADVDLSLFDILGAKSIRGLVAKVAGLMPLAAVASPSDNKVKPSQVEGAAAAVVSAVKGTPAGQHNEGTAAATSSHIPKAHTSGPLATSTFQERIYGRHIRSEQKWHLNLAGVVKFQGRPSLAALERSHEQTVLRHPVLSTAVFRDSKTQQLVQLPTPSARLRLQIQDRSSLSSSSSAAAELQDAVVQLRQRELNIAEGEVASTTLLKLADDQYFLILVAHHICFDRASFVVFMDAWMDLYDADRAGRDPATVPTPAITYADFSLWHNARLASAAWGANLDFWTEKLRGIPVAGKLLPFARQTERPSSAGRRGALTLRLDGAHVKRMRRLCAHMGTTPFNFLLAAWKAFLFRHTGDADMVILMLDGSRPHADVEALVGYFVNILPLRFGDGAGTETTFETLVAAARDATLEALAHSNVSFDAVTAAVLGNQDVPVHMPIGQVAINYQMHGAPWQYRHADFEASVEAVYNIAHPCELLLEIVEGEGGELGLTIHYSTDLYGTEDIKRFGHGLVSFVVSAVRDHRQPVDEIDVSGYLTEGAIKE